MTNSDEQKIWIIAVLMSCLNLLLLLLYETSRIIQIGFPLLLVLLILINIQQNIHQTWMKILVLY